MKHTIINWLITSLAVGTLAGCGGDTDTASSSGSKLLATTSSTPAGPAGFTYCASENGTCSFSGMHEVAYGANGTFYYKTVSGSTGCNNTVFGDPTPGVTKACFYQTSISSGTVYRLVAQNSGLALDVTGAGTADGTNVEVWTNNGEGSNAQRWQANQNSDGSFTLINPNSGKALDDAGANPNNGANVQIATVNGSTAQEWNVMSNSDGTYTLINVNANKALDVYNAGTTAGTNVEIWASNGGANQKWYLVPFNTGSTPTPTPTGFVFGPYKDVTVSLNWNTDVMSTNVTGTLSPVTSVMPAKIPSVTWAFATGECGSENWGGVQGPAMASANVSAFVNAGKKYVISTGGAGGSFSCGTDSGFETFIQRYNSGNLIGVDFDIEAGQTQSVIDNLVQRVKVAQGNHPNLRFSFTLATLGGNSPQSLGSMGVNVMNSIKAAGLTNYYVNLMVMDYGSANASNCTLGSNGLCDMGQSAIQAAKNLNSYWGVPYSHIELTPMIGGNDAQDEVFTLSNADTMTSWVRANGLAGIHYWSLDRDTDCAPGFASPTCNSYGLAGTWGFANRFIADLGL